MLTAVIINEVISGHKDVCVIMYCLGLVFAIIQVIKDTRNDEY